MIATSEYEYTFILENGTKLNLSNIKDDIYIDVYVPLRDLDLANYDYALEFAKQGYDIYDKNSDFYIDPCTAAYIHRNDITLNDRKKDIYPNVTICKGSNCHYKSSNLNDHKIVCQCNLNADKINDSDVEDDFMIDDNDNVKNYVLDHINYKIIKCYYLLKKFKNLEKNPAFYIIIILFITVLILSLYFIFFKMSKIRAKMNNESPTTKKVKETLVTPPKKGGKKKKKGKKLKETN